VDARHITLAALQALAREKQLEPETVEQAMKDMDIDPEKPAPHLL